jgi:hypothetical protein
MSKSFLFTEEFDVIDENIISKIDLLDGETIVMSITGNNKNNLIYNLHRAWVYPNRRYSIVNGEEIFEEIIDNN